MTEEHVVALLKAAETEKGSEGWQDAREGRLLTLYVSGGANTLTVNRIESLKLDRGLISARTTRGEVFLLSLDQVFAGAVEAPPSGGRKAGFVP